MPDHLDVDQVMTKKFLETFQENHECPSQTIGERFYKIETLFLSEDELKEETIREYLSSIINTGNYGNGKNDRNNGIRR